MSLFLDIGEGAGLSGASGVRPFLPPLIAGALARGDDGIDFDSSKYAFLERSWFLLLVLVLAVIAYGLERREGPAEQTGPGAAADPTPTGRIAATLFERALLVIGIVLGALLFAGTLAGDGRTSWWGIVAGAGCAALGYLAIAALFARARRRLTGGAAALINLYADGVALGLAALSIAVPVAGYLALVAFLLLIARGRAQTGKKYQGLRILR
ncbi:MAG: DUF4126 domain-containing protein [Thermoleophilaceae bacterium]